jgi:hypothetical protein
MAESWYWCDEVHERDSNDAWIQLFTNGDCSANDRSGSGRVRFVRSVPI